MKALGSKGNSEVFVCTSCGAEQIKWMGKCPSCKEWNTLKAFRQSKLVSSLNPKANGSGKWLNLNPETKGLTLLSSITEDVNVKRMKTFSKELNRVLGGGIVPGSVVLLTGEPGIGKSTLLLQLAASIGISSDRRVIYLSGEENPQQIAMRARRLGSDRSSIYLLCEMDIDQVLDQISICSQQQQSDTPPALVIIDSIQTIFTESSTGSIGSISQIRESTSKILQYAKTQQVPVILIGHVTKTGEVAGPKILEHMVDTVLSLEGSEKFDYRMIRCEKNR